MQILERIMTMMNNLILSIKLRLPSHLDDVKNGCGMTL